MHKLYPGKKVQIDTFEQHGAYLLPIAPDEATYTVVPDGLGEVTPAGQFTARSFGEGVVQIAAHDFETQWAFKIEPGPATIPPADGIVATAKPVA